MKAIDIVVVPYFDDNFAYLIHEATTGKTALVDCGEIEPIIRQLKERGWGLDYILATHFHYDHVGEIEEMKKAYPSAEVIKPMGEDRLSMQATEVGEGDKVMLGEYEIVAMSLPAHTMYCTGYLVDGNIFVGDVLFSAGCGRLFEGTPADLERSMDKIGTLPDETKVYFGHEYTQSNLRFAKSIEPQNAELEKYCQSVDQAIDSGHFSTPTTIGLEKKINPFLRVDHPDVIQAVDPEGNLNRTDRMGTLRSRKDSF